MYEMITKTWASIFNHQALHSFSVTITSQARDLTITGHGTTEFSPSIFNHQAPKHLPSLRSRLRWLICFNKFITFRSETVPICGLAYNWFNSMALQLFDEAPISKSLGNFTFLNRYGCGPLQIRRQHWRHGFLSARRLPLGSCGFDAYFKQEGDSPAGQEPSVFIVKCQCWRE